MIYIPILYMSSIIISGIYILWISNKIIDRDYERDDLELQKLEELLK